MYADRDHYVGDPQFVPVPSERLLEPAYSSCVPQLIGGASRGRRRRRETSSLPRGRDATHESAGTSHFVVVDAAGNVVSMTTTVESVFGSGRTVGGFVLNNQLTDFSLRRRTRTDTRQPSRCRAARGRAPRCRRSSCSTTTGNSWRPSAPRGLGDSRLQRQGARGAARLEDVRSSQAIELPNLIARGDDLQRRARSLLARRAGGPAGARHRGQVRAGGEFRLARGRAPRRRHL